MSKVASKKTNDFPSATEPHAVTDVLNAQSLGKTFHQGGKTLSVLKDVNLAIARGEMVGLIGPSGSGKSTLLQMMGLLDQPSAGQVIIDGQDTSSMNDFQRTRIRCDYIGFVYQFHHLQPEFNALENVMLPQLIAGRSKKVAKDRAQTLLKAMKLQDRLTHRPARLSGGEQQRVAIARALANGPKLLLADEPTGNLDPETSGSVFKLLVSLVRETGIGALIATHNIELADQMDRVLVLKNGAIEDYY